MQGGPSGPHRPVGAGRIYAVRMHVILPPLGTAESDPWEFGWDAVSALGSAAAAIIAVIVAGWSVRQARVASQDSKRSEARRQREAARRVVVWLDPSRNDGNPVGVHLGNHGADPITGVRLVYRPATTRGSDGYPVHHEETEVGSWAVVAPGETVDGLKVTRRTDSARNDYLRAEFVDVQGTEWSRTLGGGLARGKQRRDMDELGEDPELARALGAGPRPRGPLRRARDAMKRWRRRSGTQ
ncbi:MAG: hypothetical protein DI613_18875 [Kocuria rhizophila]|nr:MAG: hypothetical protein DI613_18875 [Kocuria rhizophila]